MTKNLASKAALGVKWSTASTIYSSVLQVVYTSVMGRLLDPTSFGIVAAAGVILRFGSYFAQMGMSQALIQKEEISTLEIRSAFTSSIVLGSLFFLIIFGLADFSTLLLDNDNIIDVVKVLSVNFVITGFSSTSQSLLRRDLFFKKIALIEIFSYTIFLMVGILCAASDLGVWSLVFATLSQSLIQACISYLLIRHNIIPFFNWQVYAPLFKFGGKVSIISFMEFLGSNLDTMLIGRFFNASLLGIYNRAFMLINLPLRYITMSISKVLFPTLSRIQNETEKLKEFFLFTLSFTSFLLFSISTGVFFSAEEIIISILGDGWFQAIFLLKILAFAAPLDLLSHFGGVFCEVRNELNRKMLLQFCYLIWLVFLFYLLKGEGVEGIAVAILIGELTRFLLYLILISRILNIDFKDYFKALKVLLANVLFIALMMLFVDKVILLFVDNHIIRLSVKMFFGILSLALSLKIPLNQELIKTIRDKNIKIAPLEKIFNILKV